MWIGVDDTDSSTEMCTTYIGIRIAAMASNMIIGYPRLVRLNPNIPYKTRGNGAICFHLGEEGNKRIKVGHYAGKDIYSNGEEHPLHSSEEIKKTVISIVEELYVHGEPNTNPGIVFLKERPNPEFYLRCLREDVPIDDAKAAIDKIGGEYVQINIGRGIIGAAASIAWEPGLHTFELICYRGSIHVNLSRAEKLEAAKLCDAYDGTFNNMDLENNTPSIFPRERTPVLFGIRATNPEILLTIFNDLQIRFNQIPEDFLIYETNQGTDDHIRAGNGFRIDGAGIAVEGRIMGRPRRMRGGHLTGELASGNDTITFLVFEPSKKFRNVFENLNEGDKIRLLGSVSRGNVKVEKLEILSLSHIYRRIPPVCDVCHVKGTNRGSGNYLCSECGKILLPEYEKVTRNIKEGRFQPPVSARRHLSMPWEISGTMEEVK
jgi:tRNA(Ile2)-agmatinylcytidine synthase